MTKNREEARNPNNKEIIEEHYNMRLVNLLDEYLLDHSAILELESGTAADLLKLSKHYDVTGSDSSKKVLQTMKEKHPGLEFKKIDLHDLAIKKTYDCIYSDKVLSRLSEDELLHALNNQVDHLNEDGIILMSFPYGKGQIEVDGEFVQAYTETTISQFIPEQAQIILIDSYSEKEKKDSLAVILKKRTN